MEKPKETTENPAGAGGMTSLPLSPDVENALARVNAIRAAMPSDGLFAEKDWLTSPEPFLIDEKLADELERLGHRLNLFNRACNLLYHLSAQGRQPRWVADYLDAGKPRELVEYSRQKKFRDDISHVIRPDVILTEQGPDKRPAFTIAELDTVPGGRLTGIYHLASPASPKAYGDMPWQTIAANVTGTMSLIDLALEREAMLLFASTSEVYGDPLVDPQPETYFGNVNPIGPRACYDEGKRCGEAAMSVGVRNRGLDGRIVRIFNGYGPRMDSADGRLVPSLLQAAHEGLPLPIHGDGRQRRSMTYVDDLVEGLLCVGKARFSELAPVNLGADDERSVLDIAAAAAAAAQAAPVYEYLPARPEDPQRRRPDASLAASLGWRPRITLGEGLRRTYAWMIRDALEYA